MRKASFVFLIFFLTFFFWSYHMLTKTLAINEDSPYGINAQIILQIPSQGAISPEIEAQVNLQVKKMAEAGTAWAREPLRWNTIEPIKGEWQWQHTDYGLNLLSQNSIQVLGILGSTPTWATSAPAGTPENEKGLYPPVNMVDWENYVRAMVLRYKDKIHAWEIWNEEDSTTHFRGTYQEYAELLKKASLVIKSIDPEAKVVLGGLTWMAISQTESSNRQFIWNLLMYGGVKPYFDIFNYHGFYGYQTEAALREFIKKAKFLAGDKPLWNTEIGVSSQAGDCQTTPEKETLQAQYLRSYYQVALGEGVDKLFWWRLQDTPSWKCHFFGLIREEERGFESKPAFWAYQDIAGGPLPTPTLPPSIFLSPGWNEIVWPADSTGLKASDVPSECSMAIYKENFWFKPYVRNYGGEDFEFETGKTYYIKCNQDFTWNLTL